MSARRAVSKIIPTGWHRDHARKALRQMVTLRAVKMPRRRREPIYGEP